MKKLIAMLLVLVMALSMTACGGSDVPAANAPAADAPAAAAIKIGSSGPLTNDYAVYGKAVEYGLTLAFEEINALGGLQFELNVQDDEADSEMAVNAYNTLKDWGMQIFLGSVTSAPGVATSVEAQADNMFYLTPSASSTDVLGGVANPLTGTVDINHT